MRISIEYNPAIPEQEQKAQEIFSKLSGTTKAKIVEATSNHKADNARKQDDVKEKAESSVSRDDVRQAVAAKSNDFKAVIKAKLRDFGATSVTSVDEKHFQALIDFCDAL